ncbi:MAG: aldose 1-epimerase [Bryobacteraceae bacterium]
MTRWLTLLLLPAMVCAASSYKAEKITDHGVEVIRLTDAAHGASVSIASSVGNRAFAFKVHGKNLLYIPSPTIADFLAHGARGFNGIPFLAPWANRMAEGGFWANGEKYRFNPDLGTLRLDRNDIAIHGMLTASPLWKVIDIGADGHSAHVTSRLQFWKYPNLMANWPFSQEYEITYTLANGVMEVTTKVRNLSAKPMPMVIGFHPYLYLPGVPRSEASIHIAARKHVETDKLLVPTGVMKPVNLPDWISLKDHTYDDGYTDLVRGSDGRAVFSVRAGSKNIQVLYGAHYQVAVIYAPLHQQFVCFEPMAAVTNGANLAHYGKYKELQSVAPCGTWQGSFWVRASGF